MLSKFLAPVLGIFLLFGPPAPFALAQTSLILPASGAQPIVPCEAGLDVGCAEALVTLKEGTDLTDLVSCWSLPPFGQAAVTIATPEISPAAPQSRTQRLRITFTPLSAVPVGTVTLAYGIAVPNAPLTCDLTLQVERKASQIDLPASLALGELRVELLGAWNWTPLVVPVAPVAGQPPVGPVKHPDTVQLAPANRAAGRMLVDARLTEHDLLDGQTGGQLTLSAREYAGGLPILGVLTGNLRLTAPQLAAPKDVAITATARIGMITIFLALGLGIGAGYLLRQRILGNQTRESALLALEDANLALTDRLAGEQDPALISEIWDLFVPLRVMAAAGFEPEELLAAVKAAKTQIEVRLQQADEQRTAMIARIAPALKALVIPPQGADFPAAAINGWKAELARASAMLAARKLAEPAALLDGPAEIARSSVQVALAEFAQTAQSALAGLGAWAEHEPKQAAAPLVELHAEFAPFPPRDEAALLQAYPRLNDAYQRLKRRAVAASPALAPYLRRLAPVAEEKGVSGAVAKTENVIHSLLTDPIKALLDLESLRVAYQSMVVEAAQAGNVQEGQTPPSFSTVFALGGGLEAGPAPQGAESGVARVSAPPPPLDLSALRLVVDPRLPMARRPFSLELTGLADGLTAVIETPAGAMRLSPEDAAGPARFRMDSAGAVAIAVQVADVASDRRGHKAFQVTLRPNPSQQRFDDQERRSARADRTAEWAAAALAGLSGVMLFEAVPLTAWSALFAPFAWGFFVDLNLAEAIGRLGDQKAKSLQKFGLT